MNIGCINFSIKPLILNNIRLSAISAGYWLKDQLIPGQAKCSLKLSQGPACSFVETSSLTTDIILSSHFVNVNLVCVHCQFIAFRIKTHLDIEIISLCETWTLCNLSIH